MPGGSGAKIAEKIAELEKQICDQEEYFDLMGGEIEDELAKGDVNNVNTLKIISNAAEMAICQRRHAYLEEKHAAMMRGEEIREVTG